MKKQLKEISIKKLGKLNDEELEIVDIFATMEVNLYQQIRLPFMCTEKEEIEKRDNLVNELKDLRKRLHNTNIIKKNKERVQQIEFVVDDAFRDVENRKREVK